MKHWISINQNTDQDHLSQRGGILIESLIGLLILGIIGGGIMHTTARMAVAQRDMTVQNIAVSQMRSILMSGTTPAGGDVCDAAPNIQLPGTEAPVAVTVKGCALTEMTISGIAIDGAALAAQKIDVARPRILEVGTGDALVRIGGKIDDI